jgi:alanyl-tRNA synthetase
MKAHTAQHIVSAILTKQHIKTIQANIKPAEFSIEFGQLVTKEQLTSTLQQANHIFTDDAKNVISHILTHEEAVKRFSTKIRGKIPNVETVRILEVDGVDFNTCGGTHIKNTSEIGMVYVAAMHRDREVEFYCGEKAVEFHTSSNINQIFSQKQLNCSMEDFPEVFQKKLQDFQDLQKSQKNISVLLMDLLQTSPYEEINEIKMRFIEADIPKKVAFNEFKKFDQDNILIVKNDPTHYLVLSSSMKFPAKMIVEKLIEMHLGKGGGSLLNAQILFENEPKDVQKDIKHILTI